MPFPFRYKSANPPYARTLACRSRLALADDTHAQGRLLQCNLKCWSGNNKLVYEILDLFISALVQLLVGKTFLLSQATDRLRRCFQSDGFDWSMDDRRATIDSCMSY